MELQQKTNVVKFSVQFIINQISSDSVVHRMGRILQDEMILLRWKHRIFRLGKTAICVRTTRRVKCVNFLFHENVRIHIVISRYKACTSIVMGIDHYLIKK